MRAKWLLGAALVAAVSTQGWAVTLVPGTVVSIPNTYNTGLQRPAVDGYRIIAALAGTGSYAGGVQSQLYNVSTGVLTPVGSGTFLDNPQVNWAVDTSGYAQNNHVGIAGEWVAAGGGKDNSSLTNKGWILNGAGSIRVGGQSDNEHFFDVDANGQAIWLRWDNNMSGGSPNTWSLMTQNLVTNPSGSPTELLNNIPTSPLYNADVNDSMCANIADDGSGRITWSSPTGSKKHYVYDLGTSTNYTVYTGDATIGNAVRSRISDDGNWITWNSRGASTQGGSNKSDILVTDVSDLNNPVTYNLTNDLARLREDPNIEIIDADTAIIVWGERESAQVAGKYEIKGAVVTGLLGTPVMGTIVTLASEAGQDLRYPDIDGNLIAWARNPNTTGANTYTQYMLIPEPASLSLLALGGLALIRRR